MDATTTNYPWSVATTEEKWHSHAEGVLMVALTSVNLPSEAWKSARILRAVPNCRLILMMSYHLFLSATIECGPVHHTGGNRPAELEVCRKKVGRDWWSVAYSYSIASTIPMMNPSPAEIVELFSFVEATLIQYATIAGHFPNANVSSVKARPKRSTKVDSQAEESRGEPQANLCQLPQDQSQKHNPRATRSLSL